MSLFGYSREEMLSKSVFDINPTLGAGYSEVLMTQLRESGRVLFETMHRRKDGSIFPVEVSVTFIELDRPYHLAITRDITERKQAEAKLKLFRTLLDNSNDAIEVIDPATLKFLDINETGCRALGYSREELLSMSATDIDADVNADAREVIMKQLQQSGRARFETVHRRKDGSTFPVEVSATLLEIDKSYILSIARDITHAQGKRSQDRAAQPALRCAQRH